MPLPIRIDKSTFRLRSCRRRLNETNPTRNPGDTPRIPVAKSLGLYLTRRHVVYYCSAVYRLVFLRNTAPWNLLGLPTISSLRWRSRLKEETDFHRRRED